MLLAVPFWHSAAECPAAHKEQRERLTRLISPESLRARGIRLVEGYVDRLCLHPTEERHFSYFIFEADREQTVRDLFAPTPVEVRALERWSDMTRARTP